MGRLDDWVHVTTARELIHAYLLAGVLENAGISARIGNEHLQAVLGDIPSDLASRPHVLVRARDLSWASEVLAELERDIELQRRSDTE